MIIVIIVVIACTLRYADNVTLCYLSDGRCYNSNNMSHSVTVTGVVAAAAVAAVKSVHYSVIDVLVKAALTCLPVCTHQSLQAALILIEKKVINWKSQLPYLTFLWFKNVSSSKCQ